MRRIRFSFRVKKGGGEKEVLWWGFPRNEIALGFSKGIHVFSLGKFTIMIIVFFMIMIEKTATFLPTPLFSLFPTIAIMDRVLKSVLILKSHNFLILSLIFMIHILLEIYLSLLSNGTSFTLKIHININLW